MKMPLVSIILPIYNVEKYLNRCLDSIRNQRYSQFEVIMVNDGSTDQSVQIAEKYAHEDKRFILISQENKGQGAARNVALDVARGDYFAFIDSDDYVSSKFLDCLVKVLQENNADISTCNATRVWEGLDTKANPATTSKAEVITDIHRYLNEMSFSVWNKLFKRELFDELRFPEGIKFEDFALVPQIVMRAKVIVSISDSLYYYLWRADSTTTSNTANRDIISAIKVLEQSDVNSKYPDVMKTYFVKIVMGTLLWGMCHEGKRADNEMLDIVQEGLRKYPDLINDDLGSMMGKRKVVWGKMILKKHFSLARLVANLDEKVRIIARKIRAFFSSIKRVLWIPNSEEPLVSIVMPVYNASEYLDQSIKSILKQHYKNIELICVDDGSTDNSVDIIKKYAKKDNRVLLVCQKNQFAGVARNNGLSHANGEYIMFLDADDVFKSNMVYQLAHIMKEKDVDIIVFGFYTFTATPVLRLKYPMPLSDVKMRPSEMKDLLFTFDSGYPWNKFYKMAFVKKCGLQFSNTVCNNDVFFTRTSCVLAESIYFSKKRLLYYRTNNKNSTQGNSNKKCEPMFIALSSICNELKNRNLFEDYHSPISKLVIEYCASSLYKDCSIDEIKKHFEFGKKLLSLISLNKTQINLKDKNKTKMIEALYEDDFVKFIYHTERRQENPGILMSLVNVKKAVFHRFSKG